MAFDAFMTLEVNSGTEVKGETQDAVYKDKGAFEVLSFEIGAENNINIGSISSGGGAGKATFKELTVTKKTDLASCALFSNLCQGEHFKSATLDLRRSGGSAGASGKPFLKWKFSFVMVQDISWSGSDGDDICEETLVLQYGAMKVDYISQKADGTDGDAKDASWSRIKNEASEAVV